MDGDRLPLGRSRSAPATRESVQSGRYGGRLRLWSAAALGARDKRVVQDASRSRKRAGGYGDRSNSLRPRMRMLSRVVKFGKGQATEECVLGAGAGPRQVLVQSRVGCTERITITPSGDRQPGSRMHAADSSSAATQGNASAVRWEAEGQHSMGLGRGSRALPSTSDARAASESEAAPHQHSPKSKGRWTGTAAQAKKLDPCRHASHWQPAQRGR